MGTVRRPSTTWFWAAGLFAAVGLAGAVVWGVTGYQDLQTRLDGLPRTSVPGVATVEVAAAEGLTIYYEDPHAAGDSVVLVGDATTLREPPVEVTVTGPSGTSVATATYATDLRLDVGDRVAIAMATFDADEAGTYRVAVEGDDVPQGARVSVGRVVDTGLLAGAAGAVVLFVASLVVAMALVVAVAVRRSRRPEVAAVHDRPPAHV